MATWRTETTKELDLHNRLILMLSAGNDETLERLTHQRTYTQIALAYLSKLLYG